MKGLGGVEEEEEGRGTLLLLDTPPGLGLVVDLFEWNAGEHFLGLQRVPPGPHLCVVKQRDGLPSQHFWWWVGRGGADEVSAWRWAADRAEYVPLPEEGARRLADPRRLGAYEQNDEWRAMTRHVAAAPGGPSMPRLAVPRRRRGHDRTEELEAVGRATVLAWLEASFAELTLAHEADAFELWSELLLLCCGSVAALRRFPDWTTEFCVAAARQLRAAGPELLWREEGGRNRLEHAVAELVRDVRSDPLLPSVLRCAAAELEDAVPLLPDEDEEDMPMVVEV
jgi:hypothetical protein